MWYELPIPFFQMSRENAIKLLREISMGIEYLEHSYSNRVMQAEQISDNGLAPTMVIQIRPFLFIYNNAFTNKIIHHTTWNKQHRLYAIFSIINRTFVSSNLIRTAHERSQRQSMTASRATASPTITTTSSSTTSTTTPKPVPEHKIFQTKQTISPAVQKAIQNLPPYFKFNEIAKKNHEKGMYVCIYSHHISMVNLNWKLAQGDCIYCNM